MYYLQIAVYALVSSFGLYLLKSAPKVASVPYMAGFLLYGGAFVFWLYLLKLYPLSRIFPVAAGAIILGTQLLGLFLLDEAIDARKAAGILAILAGIVLLAPQST